MTWLGTPYPWIFACVLAIIAWFRLEERVYRARREIDLEEHGSQLLEAFSPLSADELEAIRDAQNLSCWAGEWYPADSDLPLYVPIEWGES